MTISIYIFLSICTIVISEDIEEFTEPPIRKCNYGNEEWQENHDTCDPTCSHPDMSCGRRRVSGCFCKEGYVRSGKGCIALDQCPLTCIRENEMWYDCHGGCEPTCTDPKLKCRGCARGCFCKPDYVRRNANARTLGKCILFDECTLAERCLRKNETWSESGCDGTCEYPDYSCEETREGCFCTEGYVRDIRHRCILLDDCNTPPKCRGVNEEWLTCHGGCDGTCDEPNPQCEECINGCFCKEGYVRNDQNKCILLVECPTPPECHGFNEEWYTCHGGCDGTCENPDPQCEGCIKGCFCKVGFVRNEYDECIEKRDCPTEISKRTSPIQTCTNQNETLKIDYKGCDRTCQEPDKVCSNANATLGCFCKDGYVRNENYNCIKKEDCIKLNCKINEVPNWCPDYCTFDDDCPLLIEAIMKDCEPPEEVPYPCYPRCDCRPEFVRIGNDCLSPEYCCKENERLVNCPAKCDDTINGPALNNCTLNPCFIFGCRCKENFVRNQFNVYDKS